LEDQEVEIRWDPLLGHQSLFNPILEDKVRLFFGQHDWELVKKLAEESKGFCFMCPDKVRTATPRYPEDLIPGGRLIKGECTLFPNLYPVGLYHAVITVGEAHFRELKDFSERLVQEAFEVAIDFIDRVFQKDASAQVAMICANYLPPAGASLLHPHFQVYITSQAPPLLARVLEASFSFYLACGQNYWETLVGEEEERGERFLGRLGRISFLSAFSPLGTNEVQAIFEGPQWPSLSDLADLAKGISAILKGYQTLGYGTFNFTFYLPPRGEEPLWFSPHLRIITRQNFSPYYRTDDYFIQRLLSAELILLPPEKLATRLRSYFAPRPARPE
ncbi:hypothetical protein, partial [Thermosulfuriphilus sp.]